jgi:ribosomal protein L19E
MKKRDRKYAAAFHIPPKAKAKWDIAVREAEEAMRRTRYVTRKCYISIYHMLKTFMLRKSSSVYMYCMQYYVH